MAHEKYRCNGKGGDFILAATTKIQSLQEQLTLTQQKLDVAVETLTVIEGSKLYATDRLDAALLFIEILQNSVIAALSTIRGK